MDRAVLAQNLWDEYWDSKDDKSRNALVSFYQDFLTVSVKMVYKTHGFGWDYEDFFQNGQLGLFSAIADYDPSFGTHFKTYATYRVHGSILSALSSMSERNSYYEYLRKQRKARVDSITEGEVRDIESLIARIGESVVQIAYSEMLEVAYARESAAALSGDLLTLTPHVSFDVPNSWSDPYQACAISKLLMHVEINVERLSDQEQSVIKLHYLSGFAFSEIVDYLGVSKGRVSQIHGKAIANLKRLCSVTGHPNT